MIYDATAWVPRILIVVVVPERRENWVIETKDRLVMDTRAYWACSTWVGRRRPTTDSVTVELPPDQPFSVDELKRLMDLDRSDGPNMKFKKDEMIRLSPRVVADYLQSHGWRHDQDVESGKGQIWLYRDDEERRI